MSYDIRYFTADANEAISIIFVGNEKEMRNPKGVFKPKMTHQIFDKEYIFGYTDLKIYIYYCRYSYYCHIDVSYEEKWPSGKLGLEADDILGTFRIWLKGAIDSNFINYLTSYDRESSFGNCLARFQHEISENEPPVRAAIHVCKSTDSGVPTFHQRFESLIFMYIDAANSIDCSDGFWHIFYLYQLKTTSEGVTHYCPIGYCTIYHFQVQRMIRISQFFIIPPFQRKGLGARLLRTVYTYVIRSFDVDLIEVESPNSMFTSLRDKVDATECFKLPSFCKEELKKGFTPWMAKEARERLKLGKKQARRVYEILRVFHCQREANEFKLFKKDFLNYHMQDEELLQDTVTQSFVNFMKSIESTLEYLNKTTSNC